MKLAESWSCWRKSAKVWRNPIQVWRKCLELWRNPRLVRTESYPSLAEIPQTLAEICSESNRIPKL
jgi:hypothetical protein